MGLPFEGFILSSILRYPQQGAWPCSEPLPHPARGSLTFLQLWGCARLSQPTVDVITTNLLPAHPAHDCCLWCHFCASPVSGHPTASPQDCQDVLCSSGLLVLTSLPRPSSGSTLPEGTTADQAPVLGLPTHQSLSMDFLPHAGNMSFL